jgi:ribose transport system permease protein
MNHSRIETENLLNRPDAGSSLKSEPQTSWRGKLTFLKRILLSSAGRAAVALLLVLAVGAIFNAGGSFFMLGTQRDTLRELSVFGILSCGMTLVIVSGGIDLSVGSLVALVAVCAATMAIHWNWSAWLVIPCCLLVGASAGAAAGLVTARLGVQPFIATLAMMVFARGLAKYASGGMQVSTAIENPDGSFRYVPVPPLFNDIGARILDGNLAVVTLIFALCAVAAWLALSRHRWGRYLYAIGGNEEAARLSGIPVVAAKTFAYVGSGIFAAVAGLCLAAQEQQGDPNAGEGYELTAIAMVVIGGTNLMGGRGGMGLTLLGVLTIGYLDKILSINAVPLAGRLVLTGVIIVAAVLAQRKK